eukprot:INCI19905.1.p1 GENE.INCI19905.1~~INCI19905.1.p1  ORF type:complete len:190 (+),score=33.31 INCI19905.1:37-606(+)
MGEARSEPTVMVRVKHGPLRSPVSKLVPQKVLRGSELAQAQLQFARAGRDGDNAIPEITLPGIDSAHLDLIVEFEELREEHVHDGQPLYLDKLPLSSDVEDVHTILNVKVADWVSAIPWPVFFGLLCTANRLQCRQLVACLGCRFAVCLSRFTTEELIDEFQLEDRLHTGAEFTELASSTQWAYREDLN